MTDKLEQNKQTVTAFDDLMFNQCQPAEAIKKYVGDVYIQHNPGVTDGKNDWVGINIFRLDDKGKIAEHWNVFQTNAPVERLLG